MVERRIDELRRDFEGLSDARGALASLIEIAPCAIALYDAAGHRVNVNAGWRELFGGEAQSGRDLADDEVLGRSGVLFWLRRAFSGETIATPTFWYEHEHLPRRDAPKRIALSARAFPMRDGEGEVELVAVAFRDETDAMLLAERRRLEAEAVMERDAVHREIARRELHLADSQRIARMGSWEAELDRNDADMDSCLLLCSEECLRMLGMKPGSVVTLGNKIELIHPDDRTSVVAALRQSIDTHGIYSSEHRIVQPDGTVRRVQARAEVIADEPDEFPVRLVGTLQDITDRTGGRAQPIGERWARRKHAQTRPTAPGLT